MSIEFSRSMRALDAHSFRNALWRLLGTALLLGLWLAWFFFARIAVFEVSQTAMLHKGDKIEAYFPTTALIHVQPGQSARMRCDDFVWSQYGTVAATVTSVAQEIKQGTVRVELEVNTDAHRAIPLQPGLTGAVEIAYERVSPATLVLRAAGRFVTRSNNDPYIDREVRE